MANVKTFSDLNTTREDEQRRNVRPLASAWARPSARDELEPGAIETTAGHGQHAQTASRVGFIIDFLGISLAQVGPSQSSSLSSRPRLALAPLAVVHDPPPDVRALPGFNPTSCS